MKLPKEHIVRGEKSADHITANAAAAKTRGKVQAFLRRLLVRADKAALSAAEKYGAGWAITEIRNHLYDQANRANKRMGGLGKR